MKNQYRILFAALFSLAATNTFAQSTLNVTYQANYTYPTHTTANICGYTTSSGEEYALVGVSTGMDIVDVTVPNSPVHIVQIPNTDNEWKEIKIYRHYAYVTTEANVGLQIVDLNALPATSAASYNYHFYTGDGAIAGQIQNIHSLHIDTTKGFIYLNGSNLFGGGCIVCDLNADPYNPVYVGKYQNPMSNYVHDCYVDNDTMYSCHIYAGFFAVVDMTNKAAPVTLATQTTTTAFTHNAWPSNGKKYLFTTDENSNSYLTAYDISNLGNIQAVDKIQSEYPASGSIVHNTHIKNNWAITSWYRDGFVITDITRPHNLVNVGWYDMYTPATGGSGNGFNGTWGVYPFFPSGTIVTSNIEDGLYVFTPNYVRACYLEGTVMDSVCNTPLSGVTVTIGTVNVVDQTDATGTFATGTAIPGTYTVTFSKPGYNNYVINNVNFAAAQLDTFNIKMYSPNATALSGTLTNSLTSGTIAGAQVYFVSANNTYNYQSNGAGNYSACNVVTDQYNIGVGDWGYLMQCLTDSVSPNNPVHNYTMTPGYQDDFTFDLGWTVTNSATITTGMWVRGEPLGTTYNTPGDANPEYDVNTDCFDKCYVTGNIGSSSSDDDVDNGSTTLKSPAMNLSTYNDAWISYDRWFFNAGGFGNPNDSLIIRLSNGITTVNLETVTATSAAQSMWIHKIWRVGQYITPTANMQLQVYTADASPGHIVESAFDNFLVTDSVTGISPIITDNGISVYPNPFDGTTTVHYLLASAPVSGAYIEVRDVAGRIVSAQSINSAEGYVTLGNDLTNGVYFVRLMNGTEQSGTTRIVKMH